MELSYERTARTWFLSFHRPSRRFSAALFQHRENYNVQGLSMSVVGLIHFETVLQAARQHLVLHVNRKHYRNRKHAQPIRESDHQHYVQIFNGKQIWTAFPDARLVLWFRARLSLAFLHHGLSCRENRDGQDRDSISIQGHQINTMGQTSGRKKCSRGTDYLQTHSIAKDTQRGKLSYSTISLYGARSKSPLFLRLIRMQGIGIRMNISISEKGGT